MFISDHETEVDLLYYDAIAKIVVRQVMECPDVPLSIGIHGDWGAGKSSMLAMIERQLKDDNEIVCLRFNGWQLQGFEDAKAALIETIITELRDARGGVEKLKEKAADVLKRLDYIKLAQKGVGWGITLATGIPHPEQIKDAVGLLRGLVGAATGDISPGKIKDTVLQLDGLIKPGEEKKLPEHIRAFKREFEALLKAAKIKKLVVLIDDLDRCLPATAIETLEAIRLFVFAPRMVFIIAADEAMIEYSVRQHFPELPPATGPLSYTRAYLEKLIQVPFRIPALGYAETHTYVTLVLLQARLGSDDKDFQKLLAKAKEQLCKPWQGATLDLRAAQAALSAGQISNEIRQAITLSEQISRILTDGTKGNPRQIKRFLNSLHLRYQIAEARGLAGEIKQPILAKVMLAELFASGFYDQLTKATYSSADGKPPELTALENAVRGTSTPGKEKTATTAAETKVLKSKDADDWLSGEWIRSWAKIDPFLADIDLRPYMFLTRDKRSYFGGATGTTHLDAIVDALLGKEMAVRTVETQLPKLSQTEAEQVFDAVQSKIMHGEMFKVRPYGLIAMTKAHPKLQVRLLSFLNAIPLGKLSGWAVTGFDAVFSDLETKAEYQTLRQKWSEQNENKLLRAAAKSFGSTKGPRREG